MKADYDSPERVVYTPTPQPLVDLCTSCKRPNCNGMKCDEYRCIEKEIKMQQKKSEPQKPRMEIEPLAPDAHGIVANASGLRLMNIAIEALDKMLGNDLWNETVSAGFEELKAQRYKMYGERIDWKALERDEEAGGENQ